MWTELNGIPLLLKRVLFIFLASNFTFQEGSLSNFAWQRSLEWTDGGERKRESNFIHHYSNIKIDIFTNIDNKEEFKLIYI